MRKRFAARTSSEGETPGFGDAFDRRRFVVGAAGLGAGVLGLGAIGCGDDGGGAAAGGDGGGGRIAFAQPDTSSAIYPLLLHGAKEEANKRGYSVVESHANHELSKQVDEMNTWVAQQVDGIIVLPLDNNAMGPIVNKAKNADVKILSYSDKALPNTDGWVIFNNLQGAAEVGKNAGAWVNKNLDGKAKVALLTHEVQQTGRERIGGAVKALQQVAPGAEVVAKHEGVLSAEVLPVVQSMLQANPDLNVIFCIADDGCIGAERAFMQTHPSQERIDKMYIAGWDGTIPIYEKILGGSTIRSTGALDAIKIGAASITATANAIEGKKPTEINFPYVLASQDNPDTVQQLLDAYKAVAPS
jgi:ribose transport system substrate-binding protein